MSNFKFSIVFFCFAVAIFLDARAMAQDSVTVSAVGDIMMGTDYPQPRLPGELGQKLFRYSAPSIQAADIRFANFEGTFYDGAKNGGKSAGANRYIFRT
ncbi:MAG: CapA family protein, partial [Proteobacteria bacterium]